jgi:hypothetical protein
MRVAIFVSVLACLAGTILAKGYGYGGGGGGGVYGYGKGYNSGGYGGYGGGGYGGYGGGGYSGYGGGGYGGYGGGGYGGYGGGGYGGYGDGKGYGGGGYGGYGDGKGYGGGGYGGYGDGKGYGGYGGKGYGKGKGIDIPGRTYSYTRYSVFRDPKLAYYVPYPMPLPPQRHTYIPALPNNTSLLWRKSETFFFSYFFLNLLVHELNKCKYRNHIWRFTPFCTILTFNNLFPTLRLDKCNMGVYHTNMTKRYDNIYESIYNIIESKLGGG